jgi:hypothetical protein
MLVEQRPLREALACSIASLSEPPRLAYEQAWSMTRDPLWQQ